MQPRNPDYAQAVAASFARQGLMQSLGVRLERVAPGLCVLAVDYAPALGQQHGLFHGAVLGALGDTAGGYAAYSMMPPGSEVLSVEYKINFLAPAAGELLTATGRVLRPGRTLTVSAVELAVTRGGETTVCAALQQTLMRLAQ